MIESSAVIPPTYQCIIVFDDTPKLRETECFIGPRNANTQTYISAREHIFLRRSYSRAGSTTLAVVMSAISCGSSRCTEVGSLVNGEYLEFFCSLASPGHNLKYIGQKRNWTCLRTVIPRRLRAHLVGT